MPEKILATLDTLEKLGDSIKDLQAELTLDKLEAIVSDHTSKEGLLYYQRNDNKVRVRISFLKTRYGPRVINELEEFLLADGWATHRQERSKREDRYQMSRAGQDNKELMRIGKSPVPIPIGQKTEDILKNFEVSLIEPNEKTDPAAIKTVHLKLVPRKGTELAMSHARLEFWLAEPMLLPVRSQWENDSGDVFTADMKDLQINKGLNDKVFKLPKLPRGYEVPQVHPLPEEPGQ